MKYPIMAMIHPDSPRAIEWMRIMGSREVPIESPFPHLGSAPGHPSASFFRLAVGSLDATQRGRLVAHLAVRFGVPEEEVWRDIDGPHGVPILADDVSVQFDAMQAL